MRSRVAGPSSSLPSGANREPCSGHSQDSSASFQFTMPPRCGHTGETRCSTPFDHAAALEMPWRPADDSAFLGRAIADPRHRRDPAPREIQAHLHVVLHGLRDAGQLMRAPAGERLGPVHPTAEDPAGQRQRRSRPVRHAPFVETRCDEDLVVARAVSGRRRAVRRSANSPAPTSNASASRPDSASSPMRRAPAPTTSASSRGRPDAPRRRRSGADHPAVGA